MRATHDINTGSCKSPHPDLTHAAIHGQPVHNDLCAAIRAVFPRVRRFARLGCVIPVCYPTQTR